MNPLISTALFLTLFLQDSPSVTAYEIPLELLSSENQLKYCDGTIIPVNTALTTVTTLGIPLPGEDRSANAALGLCNIAPLLVSTAGQDPSPINSSTCGFMNERGFCRSERYCNTSFVVFIQAKINGTFLTICSGFVLSEREVITSPACYSSVNGSDLYVLFFNKQRIKVACIEDAPITLSKSNENIANLRTAVYVHILVLSDKSPVPPAVITNSNEDLTPVMLSPNTKCNNNNNNGSFDLIFTDVFLVPVFDNAAGVFVFLPSSTKWAECSTRDGKIISNEGSPLVNKKCEVLGFLRAPSKAFLDVIYSTPAVRSVLLNPKCELFGSNVKNIFSCK